MWSRMPIRKVVYAILLGSVVAGPGQEAKAEVVADGTMGAAGALAGPDFSIPSTLGTQVGTNLFHSFSTFNLFTGESATFSGPGGVGNVITRVTGGSASSLNGPLRCTIQGANLFFLNPAGILFGPEASLDLTGSFHASTASFLALGETGILDVANPGNDLLTTAPPQAFGFVTAQPGQIAMDSSTLQVDEGASISLIGGKMTLVNSGDQTMLQAPGGGVNLVAVAAPGQVGLLGATVNSDAVSRLGALTIINTGGHPSGGQPDIDTSSDLGGGGAISLRSGRFVLDGATLASDTGGPGVAGDITIEARKSVLLENEASISAKTYSADDGGSIIVTTPDLTVEGGSVLLTSTWDDSAMGGGRGGDLRIAADSLTVRGYALENDDLFHSAVYSSSNGTAPAGDIEITAQAVTVEDEGWVSSDANASGPGGNLRIRAEDIWVGEHGWLSTDTFGSGQAGSVDLRAGFVGVGTGGKITTDTYGAGDAGRLAIQAEAVGIYVGGYTEIAGDLIFSAIRSETFGSGSGGEILLAGPAILVEDGGGIASRSNTDATGSGGSISVSTDSLQVRGYVVVDDTYYRGNINASSYGVGEAGDITITAGTVAVEDEAVIYSDANGEGAGGHLRINAEELMVSGHGWLSSDTYGSGDAGSLEVEAGVVAVTNGGRITSDTYDSGKAGDLTVKAEEIVVSGYLDIAGESFASKISSDAVGSGSGGAITLSAPRILVEEGGGVESRSRYAGSGDGGNISITADQLTVRRVGEVNASSIGAGSAGDITIAAGSVTLEEVGTIASYANSTGNGGNIAIHADSVHLEGVGEFNNKLYRSLINASSYGAGQAGDIDITAHTTTIAQGGGVISQATSTGNGGMISVTSDELTVTGHGTEAGLVAISSIDASSQGGGAAGAIAIDAGRVTVAGAGTIASKSTDTGRGGDISIKADDLVVTGYTGLYDFFLRSCIDTSSFGAGAAGNIQIEAATVAIEEEARVASLSYATGDGGDIAIHADALQVKGAALVHGVTYASSVNASSSGAGAAGDITISAGMINLEGAGAIESYTQGAGSGGDIRIATDRLGVRGYALGDGIYQSLINASSYGPGAAGDIAIGAREVVIAEGGTIATLAFASGNGGDISLVTESLDISGYGRSDQQFSQSSINASSFGAGDAGDITIGAETITLADAGAIASVTAFSGAGGHLALTADALTVTGRVLDQGEAYHSIITASSAGSGRAGDISIGASTLLVADEGGITSSARSIGDGGKIALTVDELTVRGGAAVNASSYGAGAAGDIVANAATIRLQDGGSILSMATATGNGGTIALAAAESLELDDAGLTSASTSTAPGAGKAGSILLQAGNLLRMNESVIATASENADGGDITIDPALVDLIDSEITTSVRGGTGNGGNIALSARAVVLDNSTVSANAYGGNGGNITINAELLLQDPESLLSASSALGLQGVIALNVPQLDIGAEVANLPEAFFDDEALFPKSCVEREEELSSFVVRGRGGLPPSPASLLLGL